MWKPPERIKHPPRPGPWPTAEEAGRARLFQPVELGPLRLKDRSWVPAMVPWRATEDGFVTEDVLAWYERFARGRPAALVVEATGIRDVPSGPLLRIGHDRFLPGLTALVETVRRASGGETRLLIQLIDFLAIRRRPDPAKYLGRYLDVTDAHRRRLCAQGHDAAGWSEAELRRHLLELPDEALDAVLAPEELEALRWGYRQRVTDTHLPHVAGLPRVLPGLFADASARAREAGFDGVELHYAHAYTMASFLSATNSRTDGYGGSRENRVRLPLEVYEAVRARVGPEFCVGCRFLADECVEGGSGPDDAAWFGAQFAAAGMDFLSLSRGGKFDDAKQPGIGWAAYPYTGPSGYECMPAWISDAFGPYGRNLEATGGVRRAVREAGFRTPVVAAGGLHGFEQAEAVLASGTADLVGAARQSLADPDWFLKLRLGRGAEIRACEYTNYCEGLDQKHKMVTCKLWDRQALDEPDIRLTPDGKRRTTAPPWR